MTNTGRSLKPGLFYSPDTSPQQGGQCSERSRRKEQLTNGIELGTVHDVGGALVWASLLKIACRSWSQDERSHHKYVILLPKQSQYWSLTTTSQQLTAAKSLYLLALHYILHAEHARRSQQTQWRWRYTKFKWRLPTYGVS